MSCAWKSGPLARSNDILVLNGLMDNRLRSEPIRFVRFDSEHAQSYGKSVNRGLPHSRPQSPRSFWPVAGIESSGLVYHRKSAIHGLPIKSDWSRIRNECSAHTQKIGSGQSSRSLPQVRRIVGSGDENDLSDMTLSMRRVTGSP